MQKKLDQEIVLKGIPAAPGVAMGHAFLLDQQDFIVSERMVLPEEVQVEIARFEEAILNTRSEIQGVKEKITAQVGGVDAQIFDAHLLVLEDCMLIDEVKTGFRVARGGVQELYGIKADLCTFAKAVGNGYPISVLAGREEIMRKIGKGVAHGGTYTAHSVSLAAAEKTLEILEETDALERIADYGTRLRDGMHAILAARGIAHSFVGHPSMSGLYFSATPPRNYRAWKGSDYSFYDAMAQVLHDEGVLCEPDSREPWFISAAHDDSCLADTLRGFEIAVDTTLRTGGASHQVPA